MEHYLAHAGTSTGSFKYDPTFNISETNRTKPKQYRDGREYMRSAAKAKIAMKRPRFKGARSTGVREVLLAVVTILCPGALGAQAGPHGEIRHYQYGTLDRFHACAESVLKRHVLTYSAMGPEFENVKCSPDEKQFRGDLTSNGPYVAIANKEWAFIVPSSFLFTKTTPIGTKKTILERPWKDLRIDTPITNYGGSEVKLTITQLSELKTRLLNAARLVPIEDADEGFDDETAVFRLWYKVYVVPLRKNGPLSVVVLERQSNVPSNLPEANLQNDQFWFDDGRIIYGEMQGGKISLLWDSPVIQVRYMKDLEFRDVDGDGNKEILVPASINEGKYEWRTLSVFGVNGSEITRQACDNAAYSWYENPYGDRACPITGGPEGDVSLDCSSLPCAIHGGWNENPEDADTFHLVNGHYVSETPAVASRNPKSPNQSVLPLSAAALNAQGLELMKQRKYYEAATQFAEAAKKDSENAEYANNAGYANYKLEHYEMAEIWLDTAIKLDPKCAVAYLNLGDTLAARKHNAEAREAYKKYLEFAPDSKAAPDVKKKLDALPPTP
jgi:hypothetical protein